MPSQEERHHKKIGSLEAAGPAPQPTTPPAATFPHGGGGPGAAQSAAPLMAHWTEPGTESRAGGGGAPGAPAVAADAHAAGANPLAGKHFYVRPGSSAQRQADAWRSARPDDAAQMDKIASSPQATWLGGWNQNVEGDVNKQVTAASAQGTVPVFVAYNIPNRDLGQYSAGGVSGASVYKEWIDKVALGIKGHPAVVVLEPDALAQADGLPPALREERYAMLRQAVATLKKSGATVYLDAGNAAWKEPGDMAQRLRSAGVAGADGFSLNVSNFVGTEENVAYGSAISAQLEGKHFVVDTSRNGLGPAADKQWCNPAGRALGRRPTTETGNPLVDAYMWIKNPGESDGTANGGPAAGTFWPEYALGLAQREQAPGAPGTPGRTPPAPTGTAQSPVAPEHARSPLHLSLAPTPR